MLSKLKYNQVILTVLAGIILLSCIFLIYGMSWGPWMGTDSVAYIETARNFANRHGLVQRQASGDYVHLSLHPPLYPMVLTFVNVFFSDIVLSAKIVNLILFALLILSIACSYYFYLKKPIYSILLSALIVTSPVYLRIFSGVMSEPLFFVTSVFSLMFVVIWLQSNNSKLLALSALLGSLALLTRYVGVAVILTGSVSILMLSHESIVRRAMRSAVYSMIGFLPFMLWVLGLFDGGQFLGTKELKIGEMWTRLSPFKIEVVDIIWRWLKLDSILSTRSYDFKVKVLLFLLIIVSSAFIVAVLRNQKGIETQNPLRMKSFQLSVVFLSFSILFIVFLAFAFLFSTQLNEVPNVRILSPFLIGLFLGGSSLAVFFLDRFPTNQSLKYFFPTLFLIFSISQIGSSFSLLQDLHSNGGGYGSEKWQSSELLRDVQKLPQEIPIISNDAEAILLFGNRPAYRIPELVEEIKHDDFRSFGQDPGDEIQRIFTTRGAALVLFDSIYWQFNSFYFHQAEERLEAFTRGLYLYSKAADGEIYFYKMP